MGWYSLLDENNEELLAISDDKHKDNIFIRTYEPFGYITINKAKDLINVLENMIKNKENEE